jgi:5'-3' exonuclease
MIIVDLSHLFFRNFHIGKNDILEWTEDETGKKSYTGTVNTGYLAHMICASMLMFANKFGASESNPLVIAADSKPSWRHDYYIKHSKKFKEYQTQTYKGDRDKDDEIPWEALWEAFDEIVYVFDKFTDFAVVKVDKAEADDIVAVLARKYGAYEHVYICSSDKDFRQLQTETVHIYDPIRKSILSPIDVDRYKKMHILLAGDDNIKQVKKGAGEKTCEKWINEGLDTILQTNPDIRERYEFNRVLIDFDCIPEDLQNKILHEYEGLTHYSHSPSKLISYFSKRSMRKMAERLPEFRLQGKAAKPTRIRMPSDTVAKQVDASIEEFFS